MTINRDDQRFWDTRTLERRISRGFVTRKDIDKHIKSLPDAGDKALTLDLSNDDSDVVDAD